MSFAGGGSADRRHKSLAEVSRPSQQLLSNISNTVFSFSALAYLWSTIGYQTAFREPYVVLVGNFRELVVAAITVPFLVLNPIVGALSQRDRTLRTARIHSGIQCMSFLTFGIATYLFTYKAKIQQHPGRIDVTLVFNLNDWGLFGDIARYAIHVCIVAQAIAGVVSGVVTLVAVCALYVVARRASQRLTELAEVEKTFWIEEGPRMRLQALTPSGHPWLSIIPPEIVDEICKYLGVYHLLFVCLVDKRLNAVGTRWLYRGVTLKNARQSIKFFRTIIRSDVAAKSVRTLTLDPSMGLFIWDWLPAYHKLMAAAMRRMVNIENLPLQASRSLPLLLADAHFPSLQRCDIHLTSATPAFLSRHQRLRTVHFRSGLANNLNHAFFHDEFARGSAGFSRLEILTCPSYIAGAILPQPNIRSLAIVWNGSTMAQDAPEVYAKLSMLDHTLDVLHNITTMSELPTHIRAMKDRVLLLAKLNFLVTDIPTRPHQDVFLQFEDALRSTPLLKVLYITGATRRPVLPDVDALDEEQDIVQALWARRPSLTQVILGSGTNWIVAAQGVVLPSFPQRPLYAAIPDSRLTARWIERSVRSGRIRWDYVPQVMDLPYVNRLELVVPMISWALRERRYS
ncbi:hypothetical protein K523DRAFT_419074 [Schizophyllum commune Tattone D]|nr:hypothetical protein K523DRAFT_419074 [Schizophyllum commune Tattone D]